MVDFLCDLFVPRLARLGCGEASTIPSADGLTFLWASKSAAALGAIPLLKMFISCGFFASEG